MYKVVFLRHGQSVYNKDNLFTGWVDVGLSEQGRQESQKAGKLLKEQGIQFDLTFCSVLKRAKQTLEIVLEALGQQNIEQRFVWQLNERHYGALQGKAKKETARKVGQEQLQLWRRSFKIKPPQLSKTDKMYPGNDPIYQKMGLSEEKLPLGESLEDAFNRVVGYWQESMAPEIKKGRRVLVSGHGSTMRIFKKYFEHISDKDIEQVNIPYGIPLMYELDKNLEFQKSYYLAEQQEVAQIISKVACESKI